MDAPSPVPHHGPKLSAEARTLWMDGLTPEPPAIPVVVPPPPAAQPGLFGMDVDAADTADAPEHTASTARPPPRSQQTQQVFSAGFDSWLAQAGSQLSLTRRSPTTTVFAANTGVRTAATTPSAGATRQHTTPVVVPMAPPLPQQAPVVLPKAPSIIPSPTLRDPVITSTFADAVLTEDRAGNSLMVRFLDKPHASVRSSLHEAGFRWRGSLRKLDRSV
ncbi:MAG: hypothetical protein IPK82_23945 [Polyangiaceae bacterium]|nr:hypothetical protein [Polyangiaceae bacterium]